MLGIDKIKIELGSALLRCQLELLDGFGRWAAESANFDGMITDLKTFNFYFYFTR